MVGMALIMPPQRPLTLCNRRPFPLHAAPHARSQGGQGDAPRSPFAHYLAVILWVVYVDHTLEHAEGYASAQESRHDGDVLPEQIGTNHSPHSSRRAHRSTTDRLLSCSRAGVQSATAIRALYPYPSTQASALQSVEPIVVTERKSSFIGNIKTEIFRHLPKLDLALTVRILSWSIQASPLTMRLFRHPYSSSTPSSTVRSRSSGLAPCPRPWNTMGRFACRFSSICMAESNIA